MKNIKTMLAVDLRRMFQSKLFYILIACALLIPILMNVMMTMMDGSESVNQQTGEVTIIHGPENTWQSIGTLPGQENGVMGGMDVMSMCNINMMFMLVAVFICLFISDDFRSGFSKNLFTVRAKKGNYVLSKIIAGFICGSLMLVLYFAGAVLGGAICGLSFDLGSLTAGNMVMCMASKVFLMPVFVSIFVTISVAAKQRAWLSICGSLGGGMILFMMVGMVTPLNATMMNVVLCLGGGLIFDLGLGMIGNLILKKRDIL